MKARYILLILVLTIPVFRGMAGPTGNSALFHQVQPGETLFGIASHYGVSVKDLLEINSIEDASRLQAGQKLEIPAFHVVQRGETLYSIARKNQVSVEDLVRWNRLTVSSSIYPGQKLLISSGDSGKNIPSPGSTVLSPPSRGESRSWPVAGPIKAAGDRGNGVYIYGAPGAYVKNVAGGRVIWSGPYRGFNRVVMIEKEDWLYIYAGLSSLFVSEGDQLEKNAELGRIGTSPAETIAASPRLYFSIYKNGNPRDPVAVLR